MNCSMYLVSTCPSLLRFTFIHFIYFFALPEGASHCVIRAPRRISKIPHLASYSILFITTGKENTLDYFKPKFSSDSKKNKDSPTPKDSQCLTATTSTITAATATTTMSTTTPTTSRRPSSSRCMSRSASTTSRRSTRRRGTRARRS